MFRSCSEVIKFIMYEAYPGRATKSKEGNPDIGNSSEVSKTKVSLLCSNPNLNLGEYMRLSMMLNS